MQPDIPTCMRVHNPPCPPLPPLLSLLRSLFFSSLPTTYVDFLFLLISYLHSLSLQRRCVPSLDIL